MNIRTPLHKVKNFGPVTSAEQRRMAHDMVKVLRKEFGLPLAKKNQKPRGKKKRR